MESTCRVLLSLAGRIVELKVIPGQTVQAGQMVAAMESLELDRLVLELRAASRISAFGEAGGQS